MTIITLTSLLIRVTALYAAFLCVFKDLVDFSGLVVSELCPFDHILNYTVCFPNCLHIVHVI